MSQTWPLIQRQGEFDVILRALTADAGTCGVVLTGAAGVGKTTLARFATASLPGGVRWVAGTESARSIPLGVFAHLVGSATSRDPVNFLAAAREALLADGTGIVIGVDDAHLLDQLSATFLHQLAIDGVAHIVATVRTGESVPDAVTSLWKDGYLEHLELTPFSRDQSTQYIESVLGGTLEELSADRMWEASGGNALFLRHLVEGALEAGTLREKRGVWQLRGRAAITSELAALLEGRIAQLPDDVLRCLQLLAFCEPIDLDTLASIAGEDAIEEAEGRGLIRIHEDGPQLEVRYAHPLFSEVIRAGVGRAAARRLRGSLVEALQSSDLSTPAAHIRLAELALESDRAPDIELLTSAARSAIRLADFGLGERFARAAVRAGGGFDAAQLLARTLLWLGRCEEAETLLARFEPDELDPAQLLRWGMTRASNLFFGKGDVEAAEQVLALLRDRVDHPSLTAAVRALSAACAVARNRIDEGLEEADAALAEPDLLPWTVEFATYAQLWAYGVSGRTTAACAVAARNDTVADQVDGLFRYMAAVASVHAQLLAGEFDAAERRARHFLDNASSLEYLAWGQSSVVVADVELARGRVSDAARRLEQAIAALSVGPSTNAIAWVFPAYGPLVVAYALLGRVADAEAILEVAAARHSPLLLNAVQHELARAWLFAARGELSRALATARSVAESASESGQFGVEALALYTATRFGDTGTASRLAELAEVCDGRLVPLAAAQAAAVAVADHGKLVEIAREYETIGIPIDAADAYAQAAQAAMAAGHRTEALNAAAAANTLAEQCDHVTTPAILDAAQPLPLTKREREIATMVATGLTNQEIADRLVVSVRTVEGHIYRACMKLGVTDRTQLGEALRNRNRKRP